MAITAPGASCGTTGGATIGSGVLSRCVIRYPAIALAPPTNNASPTSVGQNRDRRGAIMFGTLARGGSGIVASISWSVDADPIAVEFGTFDFTESIFFCGSMTRPGTRPGAGFAISSIASASSIALWNRSFGDFAIALSTSSCSPAGNSVPSATRSASRGIGAPRCIPSSASVSSAANGRSPTIISNSTTPTAYRSVRASIVPPGTVCSGAM